MTETLKTTLFVASAVALTFTALFIRLGVTTPKLISDPGELFYPDFKDTAAVKWIDRLVNGEAKQ